MARNAVVHKVDLSIADIDRNYYETHSLTVARHPSETELRMMRRIVVFALYADAGLEFGGGISTEDEPDLWRKDDTGEIKLWIELGQPDEKRIRKACSKAERVVIVPSETRSSSVWWSQIAGDLTRFQNLEVQGINESESGALEALVERTMTLNATIQEGRVLLANGATSVELVVGSMLENGVIQD